jgi:hypothetical protein
MVTAHPHPRAPQRPSLALRAARKGGGKGGRLPAPGTHLGCPGYHSDWNYAVAKWQRTLPLNTLTHHQRALTPGRTPLPQIHEQFPERDIGVSHLPYKGSQGRKGSPRAPREPGTWKGISLSPACPPPPAERKRGAGSRKPGKDPEARRPHSGAVITGTCPSRPRLPPSLSHFFPCWKVPVP